MSHKGKYKASKIKACQNRILGPIIYTNPTIVATALVNKGVWLLFFWPWAHFGLKIYAGLFPRSLSIPASSLS